MIPLGINTGRTYADPEKHKIDAARCKTGAPGKSLVTIHRAALVPLFALLLGGCASQVLDDLVVNVGDFAAPRPCQQPMKLFNVFSVHTKRIAWTGDAAGASNLTLELVFANDKTWPIALSNSGSGVHYSVEFVLRGEKGGNYLPKEATGVVVVREPKQLRERTSKGPFSKPTSSGADPKRQKAAEGDIRDVNFRIRPEAREEGKLVFQVPRGNYLLSIERKFTGRSLPSQPTDHVAVCKIPSVDIAVSGPDKPARVY